MDVLLNKHKQQVIEYNRKRLIPIVKTIIFCAKNNLSLRGHRECGSMASEDIRNSCLSGEQGTLRALLAFRVESGDKDLLSHFDTSSKNCTMISSVIQNEIIDVIGNLVIKKIVERVKLAKYYSILCDETTDVSTLEQMTICVRYVDVTTWVIREDFLGFIEMVSTTGTVIKNTIEQKLVSIGLNIENIRGQGYDGGSNMSGRINGVQALILKEQPLAFYTHCFNHSLNLCLSKACEVSAIKNMNGIISTISTFFSASAIRVNKLKSIIESDEKNNIKKNKLKTLCETRWVERHDALITFKELFLYIIEALDDYENNGSKSDSSSKAAMYGSAIRKSDFLVSLEVAVFIFSYTLNLSQILQSKQQDLSKALNDVITVRESLESIRKDVDNHFKNIFSEVLKIASKIDVDIKIPRVCGKQNQRANVNVTNPEDYYKITIFIPFIDQIICELRTRFDQRLREIIPLEGLIPSHFNKYDNKTILEAAKIYENDLSLNAIVTLKAELSIWQNQWKDDGRNSTVNKPQTAIETLPYCTSIVPNIKLLLQIFTTLPVTTATPERTFSTLKRLKTYLRSTMTENRLNGLALVNINKKEVISETEIIEDFAEKAPRKLQLVDWSK